MKYFFDTEFIEGFKKPLRWMPTLGSFNRPYHSIQLISIGVVCEDGREYYAISKDFNPNDADDWVRKNVLDKIQVELWRKQSGFFKYHFDFGLKQLLRMFGKSNKRIAEEIKDFISLRNTNHWLGYTEEFRKTTDSDSLIGGLNDKYKPEFYAYYADYDWVVFCSLFGRMIDLPKGFPMYCKDLKQMLDNYINNQITLYTKSMMLVERPSFEAQLRYIKNHPEYPKQENEHSALDDARWNKSLYKFLTRNDHARPSS